MGAGTAASLRLRARIEADRSRREGSAVRVGQTGADRGGLVTRLGRITCGKFATSVLRRLSRRRTTMYPLPLLHMVSVRGAHPLPEVPPRW